MRRLEPGEAPFLSLFLLDDPERVPALVVGVDVDEVLLAIGGGERGAGQAEQGEQGGCAG